MTNHKKTVLVVLLMSVVFTTILNAEDVAKANQRFARIILFVPSGSEMPPAYEEKLHSVAVRTESFFATGIERYGWKVERRDIFSRDKSGKVQVTVVRKELPDGVTGRDVLPFIRTNAVDEAIKKMGEDATKQSAWWIFYHCPDHNVRGFNGGGGRDGGRCINAYPIADGKITPNIDLASKEMWPLNLKGCIHEFGHALGLPHIGPNPSKKLGNTLMGPINKAYASKMKEDTRVYLSEAGAAMLVKHPLFANSQQVESLDLQSIKAPDISVTETANNTFKVQGTVTSKSKVHSVIVLDSPRGFGDYWTRSYCAKIGDTGEFSVDVNDIFDSPKGKLMIFFCLDNGLNSASGQREVGRSDFIEFSYEGAANERKFTRALHPSKPGRRSRPRPSSGGRPDRKKE